jgi:hypothetical protein
MAVVFGAVEILLDLIEVSPIYRKIQLPNELTSTFKELQVLKLLRKAGIILDCGRVP